MSKILGLELTEEISKKTRALRKGFERLRAEQRRMAQNLREEHRGFPPIDGYYRIGRLIGGRAVRLLKKSGIDYWTFHRAMLYNESIEEEKTGKQYTACTWLLFWTMGHEVSGHSGD